MGEDVYFDDADGMLKGNIKVFSDGLKELVDNGLKELSLGYKCNYEFTPGTLKGERFDAIQTDIRGNHLASVEEGRMGPEVAVLDSAIVTFDSREFAMATKQKARKKTPQKKVVKKPTADNMEDGNGNGNMMDMENMTLEGLGMMVQQLMPLLEQVEMLKAAVNGGGEEPMMEEAHEEPEMDMEEEDMGNHDMEEMDEEENMDEMEANCDEEEAEDMKDNKNGMDTVMKELKGGQG